MTNHESVKAEFDRLLAQEKWRLTKPVTFKINPLMTTGLGKTKFLPGEIRIEVARWALEALTEAEVIDTVRHEMAHAVAGPRQGHGPLWKAHARRLGATPTATTETTVSPRRKNAKIEAFCPTCDKVVGTMTRMPKATKIHRDCRTPVTWRPVMTRPVMTLFDPLPQT